MTTNSFSTEISIQATPERVFDGITDVRGWWSPDIEGSTTAIGDEFIFRDRDNLFARFRITEVEPGQRMVWQVLESELTFVADRDEWTGTRVTFDLTARDGETVLSFCHEGLLPSVECYESCSVGWSACMASLRELVTSGVSQTV